jgi:mono/diheme cytochrome c family protein
MRKFLKRTAIVLLVILIVAYVTIELMQNKKFEAPYPAIKASKDSAVIARGKALVFGAAHCADCHAPAALVAQAERGEEVPLSGGQVFKLPIGLIYPPNITQHATGIINQTDGELARALRFGVRNDGTALFDFMPFHNTSDEDLTAIISFLRSQPGVENKVPKNKKNLLGKAVAAFLLKPTGPTGPVPVAVTTDTTVAYGSYLAKSVANCRGCHTNRDMMSGAFIGEDFAGGFKMDTPTDSGTYYITTPNLTTDATGRITGWTEEQFKARFRMGRTIPQSHMPWGPFSRMSDDQLKAIYKFLQTVKPVQNKVIAGAVLEK